MGKRSNFERNPRDYYPTPESAILPLLPHLQPHMRFAEPCAGDGRLSKHLIKHGHACYWQSDIDPQSAYVQQADALKITNPLKWADIIITNTPWDRKILHPMIEHFRTLNAAWLLLDADYAHTKQASQYLKYCSWIVSVGRIKWIDESKSTGKENACWYKFEMNPCETIFWGR